MRFLYVVRDVKAEDVGEQVMVCKADAVAVRAFTDALQNAPGMSKWPEDYELLCVGSLLENGVVQGEVEPVVILTGKQWKLSQQAAADAAAVEAVTR